MTLWYLKDIGATFWYNAPTLIKRQKNGKMVLMGDNARDQTDIIDKRQYREIAVQ